MPVRVTITDIETGDSESSEVDNDYIIVTAGTCYLHHFQTYGNGTHVLTVKGRVENLMAKLKSSLNGGSL